MPQITSVPLLWTLAILAPIALGTIVFLCLKLFRLKSQNALLRALIYGRLNVGVAEFRFGRIVQHCNSTVERMLGMSRDEIIGKPLPVPESQNAQWSELETRLRNGKPFWNVETLRERKDGSVFRAYISGIPIVSVLHGVVGYFGMMVEANWAEKRGMAAMKFAALTDNSSDFLLLLDPNLRITYANPTVAAMTGIDVDHIEGRHILDCIAEEDHDAVLACFRDFLCSGMNDEYSPQLRLKHCESGVRTLIQFAIYPLFDSPGERPSAIACVARDQSYEFALIQRLRMRRNEIETLLAAIPVGVVTLNLRGIAMSSNKRFQEMMGYTADEIRDTTFDRFVHPEELRERRERFQRLAMGKIDNYDVAKRLMNKSGRIVRVRTKVMLMRREDGTSSHAISIITPVDLPPLQGGPVKLARVSA